MLEQYKKKGTVCMEYNSMNQWGEIQASQRESLSAYTAKTFLWMFAGLLVTFAMTLSLIHIFFLKFFAAGSEEGPERRF